MSPREATRIAGGDARWPDPVPIASERVLAGEPAASTLVLRDEPGCQLGMWRVSPGAFRTDHAGYVEYIHVIAGSGRLVDSAGAVTVLAPGTTVLMEAGWCGRWEVEETITKVYTIVTLADAATVTGAR